MAKESVKGIGFDATCSLTVCDGNGEPMSVSPGQWGTGSKHFNVVLWADHRAEAEANMINSCVAMLLRNIPLTGALTNSTGSMVLNYVGGTVKSIKLPVYAVR